MGGTIERHVAGFRYSVSERCTRYDYGLDCACSCRVYVHILVFLEVFMSAIIDVLNQLNLLWVFQLAATATIAIFVFKYFTGKS